MKILWCPFGTDLKSSVFILSLRLKRRSRRQSGHTVGAIIDRPPVARAICPQSHVDPHSHRRGRRALRPAGSGKRHVRGVGDAAPYGRISRLLFPVPCSLFPCPGAGAWRTLCAAAGGTADKRCLSLRRSPVASFCPLPETDVARFRNLQIISKYRLKTPVGYGIIRGNSEGRIPNETLRRHRGPAQRGQVHAVQ